MALFGKTPKTLDPNFDAFQAYQPAPTPAPAPKTQPTLPTLTPPAPAPTQPSLTPPKPAEPAPQPQPIPTTPVYAPQAPAPPPPAPPPAPAPQPWGDKGYSSWGSDNYNAEQPQPYEDPGGTIASGFRKPSADQMTGDGSNIQYKAPSLQPNPPGPAPNLLDAQKQVDGQLKLENEPAPSRIMPSMDELMKGGNDGIQFNPETTPSPFILTPQPEPVQPAPKPTPWNDGANFDGVGDDFIQHVPTPGENKLFSPTPDDDEMFKAFREVQPEPMRLTLPDNPDNSDLPKMEVPPSIDELKKDMIGGTPGEKDAVLKGTPPSGLDLYDTRDIATDFKQAPSFVNFDRWMHANKDVSDKLTGDLSREAAGKRKTFDSALKTAISDFNTAVANGTVSYDGPPIESAEQLAAAEKAAGMQYSGPNEADFSKAGAAGEDLKTFLSMLADDGALGDNGLETVLSERYGGANTADAGLVSSAAGSQWRDANKAFDDKAILSGASAEGVKKVTDAKERSARAAALAAMTAAEYKNRPAGAPAPFTAPKVSADTGRADGSQSGAKVGEMTNDFLKGSGEGALEAGLPALATLNPEVIAVAAMAGAVAKVLQNPKFNPVVGGAKLIAEGYKIDPNAIVDDTYSYGEEYKDGPEVALSRMRKQGSKDAVGYHVFLRDKAGKEIPGTAIDLPANATPEQRQAAVAAVREALRVQQAESATQSKDAVTGRQDITKRVTVGTAPTSKKG